MIGYAARVFVKGRIRYILQEFLTLVTKEKKNESKWTNQIFTGNEPRGRNCPQASIHEPARSNEDHSRLQLQRKGIYGRLQSGATKWRLSVKNPTSKMLKEEFTFSDPRIGYRVGFALGGLNT